MCILFDDYPGNSYVIFICSASFTSAILCRNKIMKEIMKNEKELSCASVAKDTMCREIINMNRFVVVGGDLSGIVGMHLLVDQAQPIRCCSEMMDSKKI